MPPVQQVPQAPQHYPSAPPAGPMMPSSPPPQAPAISEAPNPIPVAPPPSSPHYGDEPYEATVLHSPSHTPSLPPVPPREAPTKHKGGVLPVVGALIGGLVLGLGLGAGAYFGGLVPSRGATPSASTTPTPTPPPKVIAVDIDRLPKEFLGLPREDLNGASQAANVRAAAEALGAAAEKSYGGPGIQMLYTAPKGGPGASVWLQNGLLASPVLNTDLQMIKSQSLSGWLEAPGTPTTQCRINSYPAVKLPANATAADVTAAKKTVIDGRGDALVICTRRDTERNVSLQVGAQGWVDAGTRGEVSTKVATALDEAFPELTK